MKKFLLSSRLFAHTEFSDNKFSSEEIIKDKIDRGIDLFNRGHKYQKVKFDNSFPKFILENKEKFQKWII